MDRNDVLTTCLTVTGWFEDGTPELNYDVVTGNFDDMGLSVGLLQWCAGAGSLGKLLRQALNYTTPQEADAFFSVPYTISSLAQMSASDAKTFCVANFNDARGRVIKTARIEWQNFLNSPASVQAQRDLADGQMLTKALELANTFVPWDSQNLRVIAFFFDVVTQSGGMRNQNGHVDPIASVADADYSSAISFARVNSTAVSNAWAETVEQDDLAKVLLHYAYYRAMLSRPQYRWDTLSRRGAIACRYGIVHNQEMDFSELLP